ncbi:MAG: hypothetical protein ACXWX1_09780 [Aeromicrobium sp.]
MAEQQEPPKKAGKRIVRKTVVRRPVANKPAPTVRYGRPSKSNAVNSARFQSTAKAARPKEPAAKAKEVAAPRRDPGKKVGSFTKALGHRTGKAASASARGIKGAAGKVGSSTGAAFVKVRAFRIPRVEQTIASAIVGLMVGLFTVGLAALFAMAFSELRGTSTGGGRWGSLTVVIVAFVAFVVGELLLAAFHVSLPRVTSFLGVCLTLFLIMAFFLNVVDGTWAWLIVPLLGAITYAIAHQAIAAADSSRTQPD